MCVNYVPTRKERFALEHFGVPMPTDAPEVFPGRPAPVIRLNPDKSPECVMANFGLSPFWSQDKATALKLSRMTYNARSETVASKPAFRQAWKRSQFALVPMDCFFEPNWTSGKSVRWRISQASGEPFCVAALWDRWIDHQTGEVIDSHTLLTINADQHGVMHQFHKPGDEKRMLVIVPPARYGEWLAATPTSATGFFVRFPAEELSSEAAPLPVRGATKPVT